MERPLRRPKEIQVEEKNFKTRVILLALCICIAVGALGYGVSLMVNKSTGWQTISANTGNLSCSGDFTFQYYLDEDASAQYRQLVQVYSDACEAAYGLFYTDGELAKINAAPNTDVTVAPELYAALEQIRRAGNRCVYLAPVYMEYNRVFLCDNEAEAAVYDPARDPELARQIAAVAAWCNDPAMIDLELKGEGTVRLKLSGEYLAYAQDQEIETFLDFGWMKNAFIADYIAGVLAEQGFTAGYLSSYDGFTRNLDGGDRAYRLNLFDRTENGINKPAVMEYSGPMSLVSLRDYPMVDLDRWHYFTFSDGRIVTAMIDPADGVSKSAVSDLTVYSDNAGCGWLALEASSVFLADDFSVEAVQALKQQQIFGVWCQGNTVCYNQQSLQLTEVDPGYTTQYE